MFKEAVGGPGPTCTIYKSLLNNARKEGGIRSDFELAMFIANSMQESDKFKTTVEYCKPPLGKHPDGHDCEIYDKQTDCVGKYNAPKDKRYFGRGYIQLTHCYNYAAASKRLLGNDDLIKHPEWVEKPDLAMRTALDFWKHNVRQKQEFKNNHRDFGSVIHTINGMECKKDHQGAVNRVKYLNDLLKKFNIKSKPVLDGCKSLRGKSFN
ncbi:lysozyme-like domain-containing protein [Globomyces pollinis-pini]|nr:lysozyme-like domain-containing protein [Globomyces pollinis-pini]